MPDTNLHIASARRKLWWAVHVRLKDLEAAVATYKAEHFESTTVGANRESRRFANVSDMVASSSVDDRSAIPLIAGDVVGNLSAALDHAHRSIGDDRKAPRGSAEIDGVSVATWPKGFPVPLQNNTPHDRNWRKMIWESVSHSPRAFDAATIIEGLYADVTKDDWPDHAAYKVRAIANGDKHATTIGLRRENMFVPVAPAGSSIEMNSAVVEYSVAASDLIDTGDSNAAQRYRDAMDVLLSYDDMQLTSPVEVFRNDPRATPLIQETRDMCRFVAETIDAYAKVFGSD